MRFAGVSSRSALIFLVLVTECYTVLWYINPERPKKILATASGLEPITTWFVNEFHLVR